MEDETLTQEIDLAELLGRGASPSSATPEFILLNLISNDSDGRSPSGELTTSDLQRCLVSTRMISIIKEPSDKFPFVRVVVETVEGLSLRLCLDDFDTIIEKLVGE